MAFPKGGKNPNAGRPAGIPNKVTMQAREAIANFIDINAAKIQGWVDEVYQQDGPKEALNSYVALLEFAVPKLARQEHTGKDGGELKIHHTKDDDAVLQRFLESQKAEITIGASAGAGSGDPRIQTDAIRGGSSPTSHP